MIMPLGKSEKIYRYAVTRWIADSAGTRTRYEFASTIDDKKSVRCFLYVRFKYTRFNRIFRRGSMAKSRCVASTTCDVSEFLDQFHTVREVIWDQYGRQVCFRLRERGEIATIVFNRGFVGKVKLHLIRGWRGAVDLLRLW